VPQLDTFLEPVLAAVVDPVIDQLYTELLNAYGAAPDVATFKTGADAIITSKLTGAVGSVRTKLKQDLLGLGVNPLTVNPLGEIDARITQLEKAIDGLVNQVNGASGWFAKTGGQRAKALNLVKNLISELVPAHERPGEQPVPRIDGQPVRAFDLQGSLLSVSNTANNTIAGLTDPSVRLPLIPVGRCSSAKRSRWTPWLRCSWKRRLANCFRRAGSIWAKRSRCFRSVHRM